jgi:hypothetical protein
VVCLKAVEFNLLNTKFCFFLFKFFDNWRVVTLSWWGKLRLYGQAIVFFFKFLVLGEKSGVGVEDMVGKLGNDFL